MKLDIQKMAILALQRDSCFLLEESFKLWE